MEEIRIDVSKQTAEELAVAITDRLNTLYALLYIASVYLALCLL